MQDRYARQIILPEIGLEGQQRLQESRVLVVGAGGLGAAALYYLTAAGVGSLGICDGDHVDLTNLQRQILFAEKDIGELKVNAAIARLKLINSQSQLIPHPVFITSDNSDEFIKHYDFIIDCSDRLTTKYLLNDACFNAKKPLLTASLLRFSAQITLYNQSPCMRCLFSDEASSLLADCQQAGVLGAFAGMVGAMQALEAIKFLANQHSDLIGKLLVIDAWNYSLQHYQMSKDRDCVLCSS